ncbi:MAG: helix-turn-helix domain-containing protein [bacterium]
MAKTKPEQKPVLGAQEIELIKKIKSSRISRKMTQFELAKKARLSQGYIARIESFDKKLSEDTVKRISTALGEPSIIDFIKQSAIKLERSKLIDKLPVADYPLFDKEGVIRLNTIQEKTISLSENARNFINKFKNGLYYSYFIEDDSLWPEIKKGSNLIIQFLEGIDPYRADDLNKLNRSLVVVVKPDCETFIRKAVVSPDYKKSSRPILFHAVNPDYSSYQISGDYRDRGYGYSEFKINEISKKAFDIYPQEEKDYKLYVVGIVLFVTEERKVGDVLI